jgi:PAS domain S-box-containing protein
MSLDWSETHMPARFSITSKAAAAGGLVFVLLAYMAVLTFVKSEQLSSSIRWVKHTEEVLVRLERLHSSVRTVESVQRGYVITGNKQFLNDFNRSKRDLLRVFDELAVLTEDNKRQKQRIDQLRPLLIEKVAFSEETVEARSRNDVQLAQDLIKSGRGQDLSDEMVRVLHDMDQEETMLLQVRDDEMERARASTLVILGVMSILAFSMLFVIVWLVRNYSREQEQARTVLQESQVRLSATLASIGEGVYQVDTSGLLMYMNPAAEYMLGYKLEDVRGRNMHDIVHSKGPDGQPRSAADCPLLQVVHTREVIVIPEDVFLRADASFLPVQCSAAPMLMEGRVTGAVISFQDISPRLAAEKRVSEFYSTVSHELRTPLTSIRAALGLIEAGVVGDLPEKAANLVRIGRSESDRLIRLINDILDIKKIEAGKLDLTRSVVTPEALVNNVVEAMEAMASASHIKVVSQINCGGELYCDRDRIIQVLTNLVSNAIKFSPENSEVLIRAERKPSICKFSVKDMGPGIAEEEQHKLFARFQQIDSSDTRPKGGTGLGLAISKAIVEQHGGTIGVDTVVGEGSTFWIELPIASQLKQTQQERAIKRHSGRVLLIEDDEKLSAVVSEMVRLNGYDVRNASTISEAEKILQEEEHPDAIILDLTLPDGNGLELMHRIRTEPSTQGIPIVILTGIEPQLDEYAEPLLIDWITKPFDQTRLLKSLRKAVRGLRAAKVLLVEDDDATRHLLMEQMNELGISVIEARDGAQAIQIVRTQQPDLIILDIGIPAPDGFNVVKILRQEKSQSTPLLVYTSRDLSPDDMNALTLGLSKHLVKSRTSEQQFLATVRDLLNGLIPPTKNGDTEN